MLWFRWFEVFLLVSNVGRIILTKEGQEISPFHVINQNEAEIILSAQTSLRRYLVTCFTDIREKITQFEEFHLVVDEIIQGLQTRVLDPLKAFRKGIISFQEQPFSSQMAEIICNFQQRKGITLADWKSLLEAIPDSIRSRPNIQISEKLRKISNASFVVFVLNKIQEKSLLLNERLLGDILFNYPFKDYSPDLGVILENFSLRVAESSVNFKDIHFEGESKERPDETLSAILKFVSLRQSSLVYQTDHLLSALSKMTDTVLVEEVTEVWRLFDLMLPDDYPPDVIQTKNFLSSVMKSNQVGLDPSEIAERFRGHPPRERLLMLIATLTSLPSENPLTRMAQAVYPHVKFWHLSLIGKFFRPRTASDISFLLDSFLSVPNQINATLLKEIHKIFLLPDSDWEEVLENLNYSRYSKPRRLLLDMIHGLLNNSTKLPVCCMLLLDYFLRINRQISCSSSFQSNDVLNGFSTLTTPFEVSPHIRETNHPTYPLGRFISSLGHLGPKTRQPDTSIPTTDVAGINFDTSPTQPSDASPEVSGSSNEWSSSSSIETTPSSLFTTPDTTSPLPFSTTLENPTVTTLKQDSLLSSTPIVDKVPSNFLSTKNPLNKPLMISPPAPYNSKIQSASFPIPSSLSDFSWFKESTSEFSSSVVSQSQPPTENSQIYSQVETTSPLSLEDFSTTKKP